MDGLIHLYHGDGKGKTTAAMGLALRAVSSGKKVVIVQFLKDGNSSEIVALRDKFGVIIYAGKVTNVFSWNMNDIERKNTLNLHNDFFTKATQENADVLIFDEICSACTTGMIDIKMVENFLKNKPSHQEIVMTGRNPQDFMLEIADYVTEMKKIKHPFDKGIAAREGIEF